jgi:pyruvoyl-dependent arginine decarboxylase (PvlArgDC)
LGRPPSANPSSGALRERRRKEREKNGLKPTQIVYCDLHNELALIQGRISEAQSYGETKDDRDAIAQAMSDMMFELVIAELKKLGRL